MIKVAEIVLHAADEPDLVANLLDADLSLSIDRSEPKKDWPG